MLISSRVWQGLSVLAVMGLILGGANYAFFQPSLLATANNQISFPFPVLAPQICPYDLESDTSFQKYLSDQTPFTDRSYVPSDLLSIDSHFTANDSTKHQLRQEAGIQFADMARNFWNDFSGDRLVITSAYRSPGLQNYLLHAFCKKDQCATPGTSEHQAGLAIDLAVRTKKGGTQKLDQGNMYYDWFVQNAHTFGFHNTYQKGVDIDGKMVEARHRRYVGIGLATLLHHNNQTFAERMNSGSNQISCPSLMDILYK